MSFSEFISQARSYDPEQNEFDIATIYDSLEQTYNDAVEGSQGIIQSKDSRIQELESEISRLKSQNFDLIMSAPSGEDSDEQDDESETPREYGIDSLFKREVRY